jgi:hypothetical protein
MDEGSWLEPRRVSTMPVRRVEWYTGPGVNLKRPDELIEYEERGGYIIQPKIDGMWASLVVDSKTENELSSRDASTGPIVGENAGDLNEMKLPVPDGTVLIGELEAATQWATKQAKTRGFRRLHLFDVARLGSDDCRDMPWTDRNKLLMEVHAVLVRAKLAERLPLVPHFNREFLPLYQRWIGEGFEGCVVKHVDSTALPTRLDGKIREWARCKKMVTDDFVLMGLEWTDGGMSGDKRRTGVWGLYSNGELVRVMRAGAPEGLLKEKYIGTLVCEFKGWERMDSGALRHAQFLRVRKDKGPDACVLG